MSPKLTVSASPHILGKRTVTGLYRDWLIGLLPAVWAALYYFGAHAMQNILIAIAATVGFEFLICKIFKMPARLGDLHAVVMGLLLGLLMPAGAPWWIPIMGGLLISGLAKMIYGGLGGYPMNPVLIAWACLIISWPDHMNAFLGAAGTDAAMKAAQPPLMLASDNLKAYAATDLWALWCGYVPGAVGTTSTWAILLGGIYLLLRRVISWHIPVTVLAGTVVMALLASVTDAKLAETGIGSFSLAWFHLGAGGLMISAFFLATEHVSSPMTNGGMLVYGAGVGVLAVIIRHWGGSVENVEGVYFAVLFMSLCTPLLDRIRPKVLGKV